ncbi:hypothetical protein ACFXTO_034697 [Malus domestica]
MKSHFLALVQAFAQTRPLARESPPREPGSKSLLKIPLSYKSSDFASTTPILIGSRKRSTSRLDLWANILPSTNPTIVEGMIVWIASNANRGVSIRFFRRRRRGFREFHYEGRRN